MTTRIKAAVAVLVLMLLVAGAAIYVYEVVVPVAVDRIHGNSPIQFYGRVVDQSGKPLGGVCVDFQVAYSTKVDVPLPFAREEKIKRLSTITDANGNFSFTSITGYSFSIVNFSSGGHELVFAGASQRLSFSRDKIPSDFIVADTPAKRKTYRMKLPARATATTQAHQ